MLGHHHHRRSNHQMDDAELIKQEALRSKKRQQNAIKSIVPADVFLMHCYHCLPCVGYS